MSVPRTDRSVNTPQGALGEYAFNLEEMPEDEAELRPWIMRQLQDIELQLELLRNAIGVTGP